MHPLSALIVKTAQELKRQPPPRAKATMEAYPIYDRSIIHQRHAAPTSAGIGRGIGTGITGAVLGALIARIVSDRPAAVAAGGVAGGALGAGVGYMSGKREAESDNSRMLALRREAGVNKPIELEALLRYPQVSPMISKEAATLTPGALNVLKALGVAGAGAGGWVAGTQGTSRLVGYHDDLSARHVGGYVNAANATAVALALALRKTPHGAAAMKALLHPGTLGAMAGMEVLPSALRSVNQMADAQKLQAGNQMAPSVGRVLQTPSVRGAGVGAGLAGLAAVVHGLGRARTDNELRNDTGRAAMVAKDFGKFVIPAALAGGVAGSMTAR